MTSFVVIFRRKRQEDGELEEEVEVKKEPEPEAKKSSFEPVDFITGATNNCQTFPFTVLTI